MIPETRPPVDSGLLRRVGVWAAAGLVASIVWIVATRRFLVADSAWFLTNMWQSGTFYVPNATRWFGFVASQWVPVLAMALGVSDPNLIATLFGLNLWVNPLLAVAAVWWASGRSAEVTLVTGALVLLLFQTAYVVIDNESSIFFFLAALLVVLTLRRDFSWASLLLLVPMTFTHEVIVIAFTPMLAVLLCWRRGYLEWYGAARYWALVVGLALPSAFALWRALGPDAGPNRGYFIGGAISLPGSPAFDLAVIAFATAGLSAFLPRTRWLRPAFWISSTLLLALPFLLPGVIWPNYHYRARILNGALAFFLFAYLHGRVHWGLRARSLFSVRQLLWLCAVVFAFQAKSTWEWRRHVHLFEARLAEASGVIAFPTEGPMLERRSLQYSWSWLTPVRSIVFQAMESGRVEAIMLNRDTTLWQPFDPRRPDELPRLDPVGVEYGNDLRAPPMGD